MAIAYDSSSAKSTTGWISGSSITWAHTCSGSNRFLVVGVYHSYNGDRITGVTYNGVAMTRINTRALASGTIYLYGLANPDTGTNNIVVSLSASDSYMGAFATSFTGVNQTGQPEVNTTATNTGVTGTISVTPTTANSWCVTFFRNNQGNALSDRTNFTSRNAYVGGGMDFGDTDGGVSASELTIQETQNGTSACIWNMATCVLAPAITTNIKKVNNVAYANIKKINGVPIANVKKLNGVS